MHRIIPSTLAPFFQEYDFETLDVKTAAPLIIERALQFGNRDQLHWLFDQIPALKLWNGSLDMQKSASRSHTRLSGESFWKSGNEAMDMIPAEAGIKSREVSISISGISIPAYAIEYRRE